MYNYVIFLLLLFKTLAQSQMIHQTEKYGSSFVYLIFFPSELNLSLSNLDIWELIDRSVHSLCL